jgi:hypothetical protein
MPRPKKNTEEQPNAQAPAINLDDLDTLHGADVPPGDLAADLEQPGEITDPGDGVEKTPIEAPADGSDAELVVTEAEAQPEPDPHPGTQCPYCASKNTQPYGNRRWCDDCHQAFVRW